MFTLHPPWFRHSELLFQLERESFPLRNKFFQSFRQHMSAQWISLTCWVGLIDDLGLGCGNGSKWKIKLSVMHDSKNFSMCIQNILNNFFHIKEKRFACLWSIKINISYGHTRITHILMPDYNKGGCTVIVTFKLKLRRFVNKTNTIWLLDQLNVWENSNRRSQSLKKNFSPQSLRPLTRSEDAMYV